MKKMLAFGSFVNYRCAVYVKEGLREYAAWHENRSSSSLSLLGNRRWNLCTVRSSEYEYELIVSI